MGIKLNSSGGGSVTIQEPTTASNFTLTVPAQNGSVVATDASGNVGIGTASPGQRLQISNTSSSGFTAIRMAADSRTYDVGIGGSASGFQQNNYYIYDVTAGQPRLAIDTSGNLQFNSGYGSAATAYGCRAWVNFNGTGTVAIRASGNVSSITDNGNGDFTVNFSSAMPDANYSAVANLNGNGSLNGSWMAAAMFSSAHSTTVAPSTSSFRFCTFHPGNLVNQDSTYNLVSVLR